MINYVRYIISIKKIYFEYVIILKNILIIITYIYLYFIIQIIKLLKKKDIYDVTQS